MRLGSRGRRKRWGGMWLKNLRSSRNVSRGVAGGLARNMQEAWEIKGTEISRFV